MDVPEVALQYTAQMFSIQVKNSIWGWGRNTRYAVPCHGGSKIAFEIPIHRCQSDDCGYRVRRRCTGRYLPAHLRRILLMEQQVWSRRARQSALRPRVAAINGA